MSQIHLQNTSSQAPADKVEGSSLCAETCAGRADAETVERFKQLMNDSQAGSHALFQDDASQSQQSAASLFQMPESFCLQFSEQVENVSQASPLSDVDLEMLVERILVSTPESGVQEVRLTLGGELLNGTEIVIRRDALGQISVQLHAHDAAAFQSLVASQNELSHALKARLADPVSVSVAYEGQPSGNDAERRSKGYYPQDNSEA